MGNDDVRVSSWTVQPSGATFESRKIRTFIEDRLQGRTLNACAGPTELGHDQEVVRNDIDTTVDADHHWCVSVLDDVLAGESFETIIYDPPFSDRQARSTYGTAHQIPEVDDVASVFTNLLGKGGRVIWLGFAADPLVDVDAFRPVEVAHWNLLGRQADWFATIYEYVGSSMVNTRLDASGQVIPNAGVDGAGDEMSFGNGGSPISMRVRGLSADTDPDGVVEATVGQLATDRVLAIVDTSRHYGSPGVSTRFVPIDSETDGDIEADLRLVSENVATGAFETVIVDLGLDAFTAQVEYQGRTTGLDTAVKAEVETLLPDGGRVIQVGHSATLMSQQRYDRYVRRDVSVISHPEWGIDRVVTVDEASPSTELAPPAPEDVRYEESQATPNMYCHRCGEGTVLNMAGYVDCPTCGARPGTYCVESGAVTHRFHSRRIRQAISEHEDKCPVDQTPPQTIGAGTQSRLATFE